MTDYYLRSVLPASTHNDELVLDRDTWSIIVRNSTEFAGRSYQHPLIANLPKKLPPATPMTCLQNSFVYLITESMCEHTPVYFTEKTWKAMTSLAPFMLIGSRHSLSKLRDFGFTTFDRWWDESYDSLPTAAQRIRAVVQELKALSKLSKSKLAELRKEIEPVVLHNHAHLKVFQQADLDHISKYL